MINIRGPIGVLCGERAVRAVGQALVGREAKSY